jgi:hypothetical protein
MASFKALRIKDKDYIFRVYNNEKQKNPGKAVFRRFPFSDETFPAASQKSIMENIKDYEDKEKLVQHIIDVMIENITANRFNYQQFLHECIDHFEDLEFDGKEIKTIEDFLSLPNEAVEKITKDLYSYSKTEDKFTFEEKKFKNSI